MSIFAQAFPVEAGDGGEEEQSVFGPAPTRMKLDKPAANRFILTAVRHAQAHNRVQFAKQAASEARAKRIAAQPFLRGRPQKPAGEEEEEEEEEQGYEEEDYQGYGQEEEEEEEAAPPPPPVPVKPKPARTAVRKAARSGTKPEARSPAAKPAPAVTPAAAPPKRLARRTSMNRLTAASPVQKPKSAKQSKQVVVYMDEEGQEHDFTAPTKVVKKPAKVVASKPKPKAKGKNPPALPVTRSDSDEVADDESEGSEKQTIDTESTEGTSSAAKTKKTRVAKRGLRRSAEKPKQVLVRRSLRILLKESPQIKSRLASLTEPPAMWTEHGRSARKEKREEKGRASRMKKLNALRAAALEPTPMPVAVPGLPTNWVCNIIVPNFLFPNNGNNPGGPTLRPPPPGASTLFSSLFSV